MESIDIYVNKNVINTLVLSITWPTG